MQHTSLWLMVRGTALLCLSIIIPLNVHAKDEHPCFSKPTDTCIMELVESSIADLGPFDAIDSEYVLISQIYLQQDNLLLAKMNAQKIQEPYYRARQLAEIAIRYGKAGDKKRSATLYDEMDSALTEVPANSCSAATTLYYNALINEALLTKDTSAPKRADNKPLLSEAVHYALSGYYSSQQQTDKAYAALEGITDSKLRDLALLHYVEALLKTKSVEKVTHLINQISNQDLKAEFYHTRLPLALARHGDMIQAIKWSHKIDDISLKTASFQRLAEHYYDHGNHEKAVQVLTFSKDFALDIKDHYERSAALKTVGKLFFKMQHLYPARSAFAEAVDAALSIDYLPRRLSGLISVLEHQKALGDEKGLRTSAFTAIRADLLEAIDEYGKPGETNRFLTAIDGYISANDRVELLGRTVKLENELLRGRILHKLSQIRFSEHITSKLVPEEFDKVMKLIEHHTDVYESATMMTLMAGAADSMADPERAQAIRKEVAKILAHPAHDPTRSAAAMQKARDGAWRLMAREQLTYNRVDEALNAYARAKAEDPHPLLFLDAMIKANKTVEAMDYFPLEMVAIQAAHAGKFAPLISRLRLSLSDEAETLEADMMSLLIALGEQQEWEAAYDVMKALQEVDKEKWFWESGNLEDPSPALSRIMVMSYLGKKKYTDALKMIAQIEFAVERTGLLIHMAQELRVKQADPEEHEDEVSILPLPEHVRREVCA